MTKKTRKKKVKPDTQFKVFWRANDRFADLFNTVIFHGKTVLTAKNLHERDTEVSNIVGKRNHVQGIQRSRDILKICDRGGNFLLLGVENQTHVHYGMPLKVLVYDVLGYIKQCDDIKNQRKSNHEPATTEEFLSGLKESDVLQPIITLVLYFGEEPWDGPLTLKDMLGDMPEEIEKLILDYKIVLLDIHNSEAYDFQNDEVATVFRVARELFAGNIEEVKDAYKEKIISLEVLEMIGTITGSKKMIDIAEREGDTNMCKALDEYWDKAKKEGHKEGHKEGEIYIIYKMIENKIPEETISRVAGITVDEVKKIGKLVYK